MILNIEFILEKDPLHFLVITKVEDHEKVSRWNYVSQSRILEGKDRVAEEKEFSSYLIGLILNTVANKQHWDDSEYTVDDGVHHEIGEKDVEILWFNGELIFTYNSTPPETYSAYLAIERYLQERLSPIIVEKLSELKP